MATRKRKSTQDVPDGKRHHASTSLPDWPHSLHAMPAAVLARMTPHGRARRLLHVGATPESLPCRHEQFQAVLDCTCDALRAGVGACAYICGVPGTGKLSLIHI